MEGVLGECPPKDAPLMAAGLDSLGATELQQGINQALDLDLPATLAFDYPTTEAICGFAWERLQGSTGLVVAQQTIAQGPKMADGRMTVALWGSAGRSQGIICCIISTHHEPFVEANVRLVRQQ